MPWIDDPVVPFDSLGNMLKKRRGRGGDIDIRVEPFRKALKFKFFRLHNTSTSVVMEDSEGRTYPMFLVDFEHLLENYPLDRGVTPVLTWTHTKKGQMFGILVQRNDD